MTTLKLFHLALFLAVSSSLAQSPPADSDNKCGGCPCNNPCNPPSPPPPPPSPKKSPPSNYCPPPPGPSGGGGNQFPPSGGNQFPPSPPYAFINGPPQDLYPIDSKSPDSGRAPFWIGWVAGLIAAVWW